MKFISDYINSLNYINKSLNLKEINSFLQALVKLKKNKGRLFILGVGGSAGNAIHIANDYLYGAGISNNCGFK